MGFCHRLIPRVFGGDRDLLQSDASAQQNINFNHFGRGPIL
jgi:hypothetical protein